MAQIKITNKGVQQALAKYDHRKALAEYIWNGFDAGASLVEVLYQDTEISQIKELIIKDNGKGIPHNQLQDKFGPFYESEKLHDASQKRLTSTYKGKNGVGRLTFFRFAAQATWHTCFKHGKQNYEYDISIKMGKLETYENTAPVLTEKKSGTRVAFSDVFGFLSTNLENDIYNYLLREFGWFLELNRARGYQITVNERPLDYEHEINERQESSLRHPESNTSFSLRYIQWRNNMPSEYSRYYCLNSFQNEVYTSTTTLNRKGDGFYHSVFIESDFFDDFDGDASVDELQGSLQLTKSRRDPEFKFLLGELELYLRDKRKPFLKASAEALIEKFEDDDVFPQINDQTAWEVLRRDQLYELVRELYQVEPRLFISLNLEQKKTYVRFLDLLMDSSERHRLFDILTQVIDLNPSERDELAKLLQNANLSRVIQTIRLVQDRYKAIYELQELVFNKDLKANEVKHLQGFIEKHYWIFGEQYHLVTSAEPKFEEALRRYIYLLEDKEDEISIDHPSKKREMDIFAVRQDVRNDVVANIVIELKHPDVKLGKKQLEQVKDYLDVIQSQAQFNGANMFWEFYLVGNAHDKSGYIKREFENSKGHGEKFLAYAVGNHKIYVKTWSEVITDLEVRHNYLNEKLQLERENLVSREKDADAIVVAASYSTARGLPEAVIQLPKRRR